MSRSLFCSQVFGIWAGKQPGWIVRSAALARPARLATRGFERRSIAVWPGKAVRSETLGRTLGGTVREHDQPRFHTRTCLWLSLIFALALPFASLAQEQAAPEIQVSADPIELAAQRVQVWETPGVKWAILSGEAAVIQAGDGLRARAAVVRLTELPLDDGKGYQAEIYAEGEVRVSGQAQPPRSRLRTVLRTRKQVQLNSYSRNGLTQKEPPSDLLILRRSGFVLPQPAAAGRRAARPEPQRSTAGLESLAARQAQVPASETVRAVPAVQAVTPPGVVVPTAAAASTHDLGAAAAGFAAAGAGAAAEPAEERS